MDIQNRFAEFIDSKLFVIACGENNVFQQGNILGGNAPAIILWFMNPIRW